MALLLIAVVHTTTAQDLLDLIEDKSEKKEFIVNAYKSTRIINTQSTEFLGAGVLDVRILHRFGLLNSGVQNMFGLDQANIRLGLDYGITKRLMIGVGRSNLNRELDGFVKYRILWQAKGPGSSPVSLVLIAGSTLNTMPEDPTRVNYFTSRLAYFAQIAVSRKMNERLTLQLTPGIVHYNLVTLANESNDIPAIGFGGRFKVSKRIALNWDYQYVNSFFLPSTYHSYAGVGVDIETGGHVFQLHFTNSAGMNERAFITRTSEQLSKMDIRFGFNLSRVFTIVKKR
jgi:hypothetical protein